MSDAELIARILGGEQRLFARIVDQYAGYVWALCSSYVRNASDCEDVTQEVFVQCYRQLDTLRNPAAFGGWLSQLARRHCLMWLRAAARREQRLDRYRQEAEAVVMPDEKLHREELHQTIRDLIAQLPDDYREALMLRYAEGYSVEESARFLGIGPAAMRKRIERGQHMIRGLLWEQVEPALAKQKHSKELAGAIVAAIPFGQASWTGAGAAGVAAAKVAAAGKAATAGALSGGFAVMMKPLVAAVCALAVVGGAVVLYKGNPQVETVAQAQPAPSIPVVSAPQPAPAPAAAPETGTVAASTEPMVGNAAVNAPAVVAEETGAPCTVSGRVTSIDGMPVPAAAVELNVNADYMEIARVYKTKADDKGVFRIAHVTAFGRACVYASAPDYVTGLSLTKTAAAGNIEDVHLVLKPAQWYVAGHVVDEAGAAVAGAAVDVLYYAYDTSGLVETALTGRTTGHIGGVKLVFTSTDNSGAFKLAIPLSGLCDFRVTKEGYGPGFFPKIDTSTEDAVFVLRPGGTIAGKVTAADGRPVDSAVVRIAGSVLPGGMELTISKVQRLPVQPVTAKTDANGDYAADGLGEAYTYTASIPAPKPARNFTAANGLKYIVPMVDEFIDAMHGDQSDAVQKTGIRVKAGQTTTVNLVLESETGAILRGKVTDKTSGLPVCPVVVAAASEEGYLAKDAFDALRKAKYGNAAVTNEDGSYELRVNGLTSPSRFRIGALYMTEGGSSWDQPPEQVASVELTPGAEARLDLSVDAPVTAPVRYVGPEGSPRKGVLAAIGNCGGQLTSGADGRVVFHGLRPGVDLRAAAWQRVGSNIRTLGVSEPFRGKPGETVPEVTVACRMLGGVAGVLTQPDGSPIAGVTVVCGAQSAAGEVEKGEAETMTDSEGHFETAACLPEGPYAAVVVGYLDANTGAPYSASAADIEIAPGAVVDLGILVAGTEKDLLRVVAALDWGRKANETVSSLYTPQQLDALTDPRMTLKTGMALYDTGRYPDALEVFQHMSQMTNKDDIMGAAARIWEGHIFDLMDRRDEAIAAYTEAAATKVTGTMRHDQFGLSYEPKNYAELRIKEPFIRLENKDK